MSNPQYNSETASMTWQKATGRALALGGGNDCDGKDCQSQTPGHHPNPTMALRTVTFGGWSPITDLVAVGQIILFTAAGRTQAVWHHDSANVERLVNTYSAYGWSSQHALGKSDVMIEYSQSRKAISILERKAGTRRFISVGPIDLRPLTEKARPAA